MDIKKKSKWLQQVDSSVVMAMVTIKVAENPEPRGTLPPPFPRSIKIG